MDVLEELALESINYSDSMVEYISEICFQINKLKANYHDEDFDELISKLALLIKYFDSVLSDNEDKRIKLDSSLKETAVLTLKLDEEKKQRELEVNRSFHLHEVEMDEKECFLKKVKELEGKLKTSTERCNSLLEVNERLTKELKTVNLQNNALVESNSFKDSTIAKLKLDLKGMKCEISALEQTKSWSKDKWVDDTILNSYFSALEESTNLHDTLFLGPSVTLTLRFGTPDSCMEALKLTSFSTCKYVFLCLSDCNFADEEDGGSHWSLLFIEKNRDMAYHFDSMNSRNRSTALIVARNLGVTSEVIEMPCMQQKKTFECGIHVLTNAMYITHHYCVKGLINIAFSDWFLEGNMSDTSLDVENSSPKPILTEPTRFEEFRKQKLNGKNRRFPRNTLFKESEEHNIACKNRFQVLDQINYDDSSQRLINNYTKSVTDSKEKRKNTVWKNSTRSSCLKNKQNSKITASQYQGVNHKVTVACDSQGRGLSTYLGQINNGEFKVFNSCQPGAPVKTILESVKNLSDFEFYTKKDCIVILGGTNNVLNGGVVSTQGFSITYVNYLKKQLDFFKHTNLILATIPYRYDRSADSLENKLIKDINLLIRQLPFSHTHVKLLDLYLLQSWCHTRHGLHINRKGKIVISKEIMRIAESFSQVIAPISSNQMPEIDSVSEAERPCRESFTSPIAETHVLDNSSQRVGENSTEPIKVIEASMGEMIEKYQYNPQVAFSHCISGDFGNRKQMSGGVAVTFRNRFGQPNKSDCLNKYLTIQQKNNRATVYGLVTKRMYSDKPTLQDYNSAFHELTKDFGQRNFKQLICSPMGCVRDKISPQEFAKNIVGFHLGTKASVTVVVMDERALRTVRNGLEYRDFVDLLRSSIAYELSKISNLNLDSSLSEATQEESHTFLEVTKVTN